MLCKRYHTHLSVEVCIKRQQKAKNRYSDNSAFCESLIFCEFCEQGINVARIRSKKIEFDIIKLKKSMEKELAKRKEYNKIGIPKLKLKKKSKKLQLKRRTN